MDEQQRRLELKKILALATGLQRGFVPGMVIQRTNWQPYVNLVQRAETATGENFADLRSLQQDREHGYVADWELRPKVAQLIAYLEAMNEDDAVVEIGALFNSIKDQELRVRCADLLTARSHFDRVINQATQVLEDRIRKKAGGGKLTGVQLVNEFIKANPAQSKIMISDDHDAQEGFANICRGVMQALRNETHHHLVDSFSREEAFHICGFIDRLLKLIDVAKVRS